MRHIPRACWTRPASVLLTGVCCTLWVARVGTQHPTTATFSTQTAVVRLELVAVDRSGNPVATLRPEEFTVTVDGAPRRVVTARYVSGDEAAPAPDAATKRGGLDALDDTYSSNMGAPPTTAGAPEPRSLILVVDQSTFASAATRSVVTAARGLLDALGTRDRIGLMAFPPPGVAVQPTLDRHKVRAGLEAVLGSAEPPPRLETGLTLAEALAISRGDPGDSGRAIDRLCAGASSTDSGTGLGSASTNCRAQIQAEAPQYMEYARRGATLSLQAINNTLRALSVLPGPKTMILISGGLIAGEHASALGTLSELKLIASLAARAQVSILAIAVDASFFDANGLERQRAGGFSFGEAELRLVGLQHIATMTGGRVFRLGGGAANAFAQVARELSGYYELGVAAEPADENGAAHAVSVKLSRPGVTVRARESIVIPRRPEPAVGDRAIQVALRDTGLDRGLPLRASTTVLGEGKGQQVRLVISVLAGDHVNAPGPLRFGYSLVGPNGTVAESEVTQRVSPVVGTGPSAGLLLTEAVVLTPARYTLRVAVSDAAGRIGSLQRTVTAGLVTGDRALLSDVLLVDPARVATTGLSPLADGRVTSDRLDAYVEMYPSGARRFSAVKLDVSDSPEGTPLLSFETTPVEVEPGGRWTAQGGVDLSSLPPGPYVLVARVFDRGVQVGRVSRPFRFEGPAVGLASSGPRVPFSVTTMGALAPRFERAHALRPDALSFFLARLQASEAFVATPAVAGALESLLKAEYDHAMTALGEDGPSADLAGAFLRGLALFGKGELEPAATQFRLALRASNDFLPAAFYLGACYAAGGRDREAVGAWQTSLVTESESRLVYDVLADGWLRLNRGPDAEAIVREAIGRWPGDDTFVTRLAAALALQQRRRDAIEVLGPYLERRPDDVDGLFLGVRLLYDAAAEGQSVGDPGRDADLAARWVARYRAAAGPQIVLADRWAAFVRQKAGAAK